jgi:CubicO group peptidase (beta-lactamase class C family)
MTGPSGHPVASSRSVLDRVVDATLERYLADGSVPGAAVAITAADGLLLSRVVGWRDLAARRPTDEGTLFEIGSIGKAFAALLILELADEGRLDVHDPVVRYLPWFRVPRTGGRITIHHLLSHTGGISAGTDPTPEATFQVWRLRSLPPGSAPGRRFHYSNVGYKALGLVVEAIEGRRYHEVVHDRLLLPLGMAASVPAITPEVRPRLAVGYEPMRDDEPFRPGDPLAPATWFETSSADGSIAATAPDLAAFLRALMRDRTGRVARMTAPVPALRSDGYGYGLRTTVLAGRTFVGHGGSMVGFRSAMRWEPASGVGAVVLQNGPGVAPNALARLLVRQTAAFRQGRDPDLEKPEGPSVPAASSVAPAAPNDAAGHDGTPGRGERTTPTPAQAVLVGTYRSHDPSSPVFHVEARGDELCVRFPYAPEGADHEQPLVPLARGWYRLGSDRLGPERLRFDTVIDGMARRAWLSGWDYYRVD